MPLEAAGFFVAKAWPCGACDQTSQLTERCFGNSLVARGHADESTKISADGAKNFTQCDSLLIGDKCGAHTTPYVEVRNKSAHLEHEAFTSKVSEDQLFYCESRGITMEHAHQMIITGFCEKVFKQLPFEFAIEATRLLELNLEGAVG